MIQGTLLALGVVAGLALAYVDSLPKFDDTGILVGSLLLLSAMLTALGYRRPWLMALAVGAWIPLHDFYLSHDPRILIVLGISLAGAYAGWAARRALQAGSGKA
jgi:hypothetical protein